MNEEFEKWWAEELKRNPMIEMAHGYCKKAAAIAWLACQSAERERCAEIARSQRVLARFATSDEDDAHNAACEDIANAIEGSK